MLTIVSPEQKRLDDYREVMGEEAYQEIMDLARPLAGKKVLHVNATATGGGVAEIMKTLVPLTNNVGLQADWAVMKGSQEFFQVTKAMHNSLQGKAARWTREMWDLWRHHNELNADDLGTAAYDFVVIHDPQPAAMLSFLRRKNSTSNGRWVWRCHIDLTDAQTDVWETLRPFVELYDYAIFTLPEFANGGLNGPEVAYIPRRLRSRAARPRRPRRRHRTLFAMKRRVRTTLRRQPRTRRNRRVGRASAMSTPSHRRGHRSGVRSVRCMHDDSRGSWPHAHDSLVIDD